MMASPKEIGERLRAIRKKKGFSIDDLAKLSEINARTLRRRERSGYYNIDEICSVCAALDQHPAPVLFQAGKDEVAQTIAALLPIANLELMIRIAEAYKKTSS